MSFGQPVPDGYDRILTLMLEEGAVQTGHYAW